METADYQHKVCSVLAGAVATLCKNILRFQSQVTVEGLLGITVDKKRVVLVNILEHVTGPGLGMNQDFDKDFLDNSSLGLARKDLDNLDNQDWKSDLDIKLPSNVLADLLGKDHTGKVPSAENSTPKPRKKHKRKKAVKEEPAVREEHGTFGSSACMKSMSGVEPGPQSPSQSLSLFGARDSLLGSISEDQQSLDDFPNSLSTHANLDYNGSFNFQTSPGKKSISDLIEKSIDSFMSSVKEETGDSRCQNLMEHCETETSFVDSNFLSNMLDNHTVVGDNVSECSSSDKFPCDLCGALFSHKRSLWRHQKQHKGLASLWDCDVCGQKFSRKDILMRHKKQHMTDELELERCPHCTKKFTRVDSIHRHIAVSHPDVFDSVLPKS